MDMQLIFCNFLKIVITKGKTERECFWAEMIRPPRSEEVKSGKSLFAIIRALSVRRVKPSREIVSFSNKLSR